MGWNGALKLRRSVDGLSRVLAIEVLTAARALDLRAPLEPGAGASAARAAVRERVAGPGPDRYLSAEIEAAHALIVSGELVAAVEAAIGELE